MNVRRRALTALAFGMLTAGSAAPARAGGITIVNQHWYDFYGAGCLTQTCYVSWVSLSLFSHPWHGDCAETQGRYTACTVEFTCQTSGWGLTGNAIDCSPVPSNSCAFQVEDCYLYSGGALTIAAGGCADFTVTARATSQVDAVALGHSIGVCVSPATGPYVTYGNSPTNP